MTRVWQKIFKASDLTKRKDTANILQFLRAVAGFQGEVPPSSFSFKSLVPSIVANESWIQAQTGSPHLSQGFRREAKWSDGWQRLLLHSRIVKSLMTKHRPSDEEKISIENGGALPRSGAKNENLAFIITGPPAAGKSRLAVPLAEKTGSLIVDPDDAKRMLPEYRNGLNAFALHEESSWLTKGANGVLDCAVSRGMNIILPTIGDNPKKLSELLDQLTKLGYRVCLVNVRCPAEIAAVRSLERMARTGRYVPLKYLLIQVGDKPFLAYNTSRRRSGWLGCAMYDSTERDSPPKLVNHRGFEQFL